MNLFKIYSDSLIFTVTVPSKTVHEARFQTIVLIMVNLKIKKKRMVQSLIYMHYKWFYIISRYLNYRNLYHFNHQETGKSLGIPPGIIFTF